MKTSLTRTAIATLLGSALVVSALAVAAPSAAFAVTAPEQPRLSRPVLVSKTSVQIRWDKVKGADGYLIYSVDAEGGLKKLGAVKSAGRTNFVADKLKPKATYTFTVKAYKLGKDGQKSISSANLKGRSIMLSYTSRYRNGCKLFYDSDEHLIKDARGIVGKRKSYHLKVNTQRCVVTAYAWDSKKKAYCVPVKSWLCSPSNYTASGTWHASDKHRFWTLFYNSYSQWTMKIHGNILFHTVPYKSYGNKTALSVGEYNKLGTPASHGCVRMPCDGVKWIYDNCPNGTKVTIYRSDNPGPFGKPKLVKIPKWHTWDPTDPTCRDLCRKHGCH